MKRETSYVRRGVRRSHHAREYRYEQEKAAWVAAHPFATSKEYEAAIRAIYQRIRY